MVIYIKKKSNPNPIPLGEELLNLIKTGLTNPKGADLKSPFGYNKNGIKYGRKDVKLVGKNAIKFITRLYEKLNSIRG